MENRPDFFGKPVSGGETRGPVFLALDEPDIFPEAPFLHDQKAVLSDAMATARMGLTELASHHDGASAEILEFQIEMLDDPSLMASLDMHLQQGLSALAAWSLSCSELIASFSSPDSQQLRDRAVDVLDLRNRGLRAFRGRPQTDFPAGSVFVARDMEPSAFLSHDWSQGGGIILQEGSDASHVAILARARHIPMVVNAGPLTLNNGEHVSLDGQTGRFSRILTSLLPAGDTLPKVTVPRLPTNSRLRPAHLHLYGNISDPAEISFDHLQGTEGIGLVRTEFLMRTELDLYDLDRQIDLYRSVMQVAAGKPVTFRLFDFGFDKPVPGSTAKRDTSPLGMRGIRLLLQNPDLLKVQIRALLLASRGQDLKIMAPVVSIPDEMQQLRALVDLEYRALAEESADLQMPDIGMMVEVPAAALLLDQFADADFFSFGTNDLAQYLIAADRHDRDVADLYNRAKPAVLRLMKAALALVAGTARPISVCGDLGADPDFLKDLVALGMTRFSVALDRFAAVDALLANINADRAEAGPE